MSLPVLKRACWQQQNPTGDSDFVRRLGGLEMYNPIGDCS